MIFEAATSDGPREKVRAQIVPNSGGTMCVHPTLVDLGLESLGFTVSHVPTGYAFHRDFKSAADAHAWAQMFLLVCDKRSLRNRDAKTFVKRMKNAWNKVKPVAREST